MIGRSSLVFGLLALGGLTALNQPAPLAAQETHLVVIRGIGGDAQYRERFHGVATDLIAAATASGVSSDRITYLAERPDEVDGPTGESRKEDIEAAFVRLASESSADDRVFVVLIGHGSFRDGVSRFNLPGPDLSAEEFAGLLQGIDGQLAFINTASASGEFLKSLAGPNRVVVTATRSGGERNATRFPEHFVTAYTDAEADLDKNGRVSVLEAFAYAKAEVDRAYQTANTIATEHAMLEDDGDGVGTSEPEVAGEGDGSFAARLYLGAPTSTSTALSEAAAADSVLARLVQERAALEDQVATLRAARGGMDPDAYEAALEELLIELGLKNREIRQRTGGS